MKTATLQVAQATESGKFVCVNKLSTVCMSGRKDGLNATLVLCAV